MESSGRRHEGAVRRGEGPRGSRGRRGLKQARAVATRQQILDAAAAAFAEKGFPVVTLQGVAESCGMTRGAVYFHFANKEALAQEVVEGLYRRLDAVTESVLRRNLPPLKAVAELLKRYAIAFRDDSTVQAGARLQIESSIIDAPLPVPYVGVTRTLTELLERAEQAGELPTGFRPEALARVLVAAFFGAQHISWKQTDRADLPRRVQELTESILPVAARH
jgi:AcrR family transcriptional regulator